MTNETTTVDGVDVTWFDHASVRVDGSVTVYVDPWDDVLPDDAPDAELILITHQHFDHYDPDAINQLSNDDTFVVIRGDDTEDITADHEIVDLGHEDEHHGVHVKVVPGYNVRRFREGDEPFHPQSESAGYVFALDDVTFYHAGDTDHIKEMEDLADESIDVAFLPIGGTYTMNVDEAVEAVKSIQPEIVIPIHYNFIEGTEADPEEFKEQVEEQTDADVRIL